ncbi:MAG: futalosine hydrolase [Bacteroidetes bacterium]|nr:futalosine hydrolase [Bacteroidota bacterium]
MDILLVAATAAEIRPLVERLRLSPGSRSGNAEGFVAGNRVEVLLTGVGMTATAYRLGRRLAQRYFDLVLNLGVAGAYPGRLEQGDVCHVTVELFGDLGAEDGPAFLDLFQLGLADRDEFPYLDGKLANALDPGPGPLANLPRATGLTVNTVHGEEAAIARCIARYGADVETMEGAAVFYTCICEKQAFAEVRAISNRVERRNRAHWNLPLAVQNLRDFGLEYLESLGQ